VCNSYNERKCDTKYRKSCNTKYRKEPYTDTVCQDNYQQVCEKVWVDDGYGGKVFKEDPHSCKKAKKTECHNVQKYKEVPYEDCQRVPYEVI